MRRALPALLLATAACGGSGETVRPASVLLITLDTTRADALSCYGTVAGTTPKLDELAAEGVLYERALTTAPITLPSHSSMLTGLYPPRHGVRVNGAAALPEAARTVAEAARDGGFQTAAFVSAVVLAESFGLAQGFDVYDQPEQALRPQEAHFEQRGAEEVTDAALAWLAGRDETRPFFLWVHLFDPHAPYAPPPAFLDRVPGRNPYLAEVAHVDHQLGRLLLGLLFEGALQETLVAVVGDHGEGLGEHDEPQHAAFCYDTTLRVPFLLRYPDGFEAGRRSQEVVSVADVAPTLAAAMGLPALEGIDGESLFRRRVPETRGVYFESYYGYLSYGWSPLAGWADARGKYVHGAEPEFFDPWRDPRETRDLLAERAGELDRYKESIGALAERPVLPVESAGADPELLAQIEALGYAAAADPGGALPHPLADTGLPSPQSRAAEQLALQYAMFLAGNGRLDEAAERLLELLAENPSNVRAVEHLSFCLMNLDRAAEAIEPLRRALATSPDRPDALAYLGACLALAGRAEEAFEPLTHALAIQPRHVQALRILAEVLEGEGRTNEARQYRKRLETVLGEVVEER